MSNPCFVDLLYLVHATTLILSQTPQNFNAVKKKVKEMGLDYNSIHYCHN